MSFNYYAALTDGASCSHLGIECSFALYKTDKVFTCETISGLKQETLLHILKRGEVLKYNRLLNALISEITAVHVLLLYMNYTKLLTSDTRLTIYSDCLPMVDHIINNIKPENYCVKNALADVLYYTRKIKKSTGFDFTTMNNFVLISGEKMKNDTILQQ